jgi:predicted secreted hydrolase
MRLLIIILVLFILAGLVIVGFEHANSEFRIKAKVADYDLIQEAARSFDPIFEGQAINFPDDLFDHPRHQIDGWFYSGYLTDNEGQLYGAQLRFIRFGLSRGLRRGESEWTTNQIYFAHLAITDVAGQTSVYDEYLSRGNNRLAGISDAPYRIWVEDWFVEEVAPGQVRLQAANAELGLDLLLTQTKPVVLPKNQGANQEQKSDITAVTYYAYPDNKAEGTITTPRGVFPVTGHLWHYHIWGSLNFGPVAGWNLFWLDLDDGREIIYFHVQPQDDIFADITDEILLTDQLIVVEQDGQAKFLSPDAVELTVLDTWQSPKSQEEYPVEWQLIIPEHNIDLHLKPVLDDQEVSGNFTYWQGLVDVQGSHAGRGYVEVTGPSSAQIWTK